jgi:hypothetical protein
LSHDSNPKAAAAAKEDLPIANKPLDANPTLHGEALDLDTSAPSDK